MNFTEADIYGLLDHAGWVAERASLSERELETLVAIVKHPIPDDRRVEFKVWLNRLFARHAGNLRARRDIMQKVRGSSSERGRYYSSTRRNLKLSTVVRQELDEIALAIREISRLIERLSPPANEAIRTYCWRKQIVSRMRACPARTFWRTWERAYDVFLLMQVACERVEETGIELCDSTQEELAQVSGAFDGLAALIEGTNDATRDVLEASFDDLEESHDWRPPSKAGIAGPIQDAVDWLSLLGSIADRPQIEVKRGRDEAAVKELVRGLAELCRAITGKEPGRVYRAIETCCGDPVGEAGDFLELVRTFTSYIDEALSCREVAGNRFLSKIVREVLEDRRGEGANQ